MDKIVQMNAANAEETTGTAEEMNAQAERMKGNIRELVTLVEGTGSHTNHSRSVYDGTTALVKI
jgi:methyl-accepting chemotaxis protein